MMEYTAEELRNAARFMLLTKVEGRHGILRKAYDGLRGEPTPEEREALRDTIFILTTLWNK